jgi:hypothetical protein
MVRLQWVTFPAVALILFLASIPMPVRSADLDGRGTGLAPGDHGARSDDSHIPAPAGEIRRKSPGLAVRGVGSDTRTWRNPCSVPYGQRPGWRPIGMRASCAWCPWKPSVRAFPTPHPNRRRPLAAILKKHMPAWDLPCRLTGSWPASKWRAAPNRGRAAGEPTARHHFCRPPGDSRHCRRGADSQAHRELSPDGGGQHPFPMVFRQGGQILLPHGQ